MIVLETVANKRPPPMLCPLPEYDMRHGASWEDLLQWISVLRAQLLQSPFHAAHDIRVSGKMDRMNGGIPRTPYPIDLPQLSWLQSGGPSRTTWGKDSEKECRIG